jgi:hypothetical protein
MPEPEQNVEMLDTSDSRQSRQFYLAVDAES